VGKYDEFYRARKEIVEILERDLIGPVDEHEVIHDMPTTYYIAGKLYPQKTYDSDVCEEEPVDIDKILNEYDAAVSLENQYEPASMGITFAVQGEGSFTIRIGYATYEYIAENVESSAADAGLPSERRLDGGAWKRVPHAYTVVWRLDDRRSFTETFGSVLLQVLVRKKLPSGIRIVTASLVNLEKSGRKSSAADAEATLFQVSLKIVSDGPDGGTFVSTDMRKHVSKSQDLQEMQLLYSGNLCYAQGHGCAGVWDVEHATPKWIATSYLPVYSVHQMKPRQLSDPSILGMSYLASGKREPIINGLSSLCSEYAKWIHAQQGEAERKVATDLRAIAYKNMERCSNALDRIKHGIDLLESNPDAFHAFQLANEAMYLQREKSLGHAGKKADPSLITWYPFQLAFLLQEISSFVEPDGKERDLTDLLWFPTGGGKTEAYLGIAAFCIFYRRLKNPDDDGVTVIMRYTLRMLTLQQFERASLLIAACEHIRKARNLGGSEISIGLWVGGGLTPNRLEDADDYLRKNGDRQNKANPTIVKYCPWCGTELDESCYTVKKDLSRMTIRCPNEDCEFHEGDGLPIYVVDDDIYTKLPTFIVSTIDKFAQLPKKLESSRLFGCGVDKRPPDLVIQDELHLITGPLGTMAGLYESSMALLCEHAGRRPKVVASTATVRNAANQIKSLYAEGFNQFPPQGISMDDSFFAVKAGPEDRPSRMYVGVMGSGVTQTTTIIRLYACLYFAGRWLEAAGYSPEVIDAYWTLVGYFNSLRELGGTLTMVRDDIRGRFKFLAGTKFAKKYPGIDPEKIKDYLVVELTSRRTSSEISDSIKVLERGYAPDKSEDVCDFVLATNMISVGVDVSRLGLMVVDGQPKSNSEYIQATSRVGRSDPGLVVVAENAAKSRDRSHFEQFYRFHSALYRNVDASSLTPFSERARDRALQAVFVTLCRNCIDVLAENEDAGNFRKDLPGVSSIIDRIVAYAGQVDSQEAADVRKELNDIADEWQQNAEYIRSLRYQDFKKPSRSLLKDDTDNSRFRTMNSMRNVEGSSNVFIVLR